MRNTKGAFTLVELIVVITILAILGTIAFISLKGYSADARNSKRTSDLSSIASSINIKLTTGIGIMSLLADSSSALTSVNIGGRNAITTASGNYDAGKANYNALGMKDTEFQDISGENYVIGVTSLDSGVYQLAASMEVNSSKVAKISGTFNPRDTSVITINAATEDNQSVVTLADSSNVGFFKIGDLTNYGVIEKISTDGENITLNPSSILIGNTSMHLSFAESKGLIGIKGDLANPVIDGSGATLPY